MQLPGVCCSILLCLFLVGCSTCREVPGYFVHGKMTAIIDSDGVLVERPKATPTRVIILTKPGETVRVDSNEVFELNIPVALNMGRYSLSVVPAEDQAVAGGSRAGFDIGIEKNCVPRIRVNRSCQKINWYNPFVLPEVYVDNPKDEQLIYTPLYNADTVIVGYEIRLGDHTTCKSKAREDWARIRGADSKGGKTVASRRRPMAASTNDKPFDIRSLSTLRLN